MSEVCVFSGLRASDHVWKRRCMSSYNPVIVFCSVLSSQSFMSRWTQITLWPHVLFQLIQRKHVRYKNRFTLEMLPMLMLEECVCVFHFLFIKVSVVDVRSMFCMCNENLKCEVHRITERHVKWVCHKQIWINPSVDKWLRSWSIEHVEKCSLELDSPPASLSRCLCVTVDCFVPELSEIHFINRRVSL